MNNYEFCTEYVATRLRSPTARVLDYGCGAGEIVILCRKRGIDAYGCDVFYEGGDYSPTVPPELAGTIVRRMVNNQIPFESNSFDCVINNQVLEHVPDIDLVLAEMRRVLKPGGFVLSLFPDRGVWREGHCGIPFLHRFPKDSRLRVWYAACLRVMGLGYHKKQKGVMAWSRDFCEWLDRWTHYRTYDVIRAAFLRQFDSIEHHESDWLLSRLGSRGGLARLLPTWARAFVVRKATGMVFVASGQVRDR
jgi:SAM-dependent methyltransferase